MDVLKYMLVSFSLSGLVLLYLPCANPTSTDACAWNQEPAVAQAVATELLPFQERGDWDGALEVRAMILWCLLCLFRYGPPSCYWCVPCWSAQLSLGLFVAIRMDFLAEPFLCDCVCDWRHGEMELLHLTRRFAPLI